MAIAKDLVSGILSGSINTSATNIIVSIGEGLSSSQITGFFPATPFHITIMPKSPTIGVANSFDSEVVKVTAVAADQSGDASLTVVRGQYDTTAKSFDSGAIVTLGVYAEDAVFKSDDVLPPAEAWIGSDDIKANAVKASNIDFATFDMPVIINSFLASLQSTTSTSGVDINQLNDGTNPGDIQITLSKAQKVLVMADFPLSTSNGTSYINLYVDGDFAITICRTGEQYSENQTGFYLANLAAGVHSFTFKLSAGSGQTAYCGAHRTISIALLPIFG